MDSKLGEERRAVSRLKALTRRKSSLVKAVKQAGGTSLGSKHAVLDFMVFEVKKL